MTDYIGANDPSPTHEQAIDDPSPLIPMGPGAAGVVAEPVTRLGGDPDGGSLDAPRLGWADEDDESTTPHVDHGGGLMDAIRGLLGRGKVK